MDRRDFSRNALIAALCAAKNCGTRELSYSDLRKTLEKDGVYFEN
jgi:hypothetical protein